MEKNNHLNALIVEELIDFGNDEISQDKRNYLADLLERTTFSEEQKEFYRYVIVDIESLAQYDYVLNTFKANEIQDKDRIAFGMPYNQSDIKKTIKWKS